MWGERDPVCPNEGAIAHAHQKMCIDQRAQQRFTDERIEIPQALGLDSRQPQTRHLEKLTLNAAQDVLKIGGDHHGKHSPNPAREHVLHQGRVADQGLGSRLHPIPDTSPGR
jgi:hypothetical protein